MITQVILPSKSFAADFAGVWPLISVSTFVNEQIVRLGKMSSTKTTNEFFFGPMSGK